MRYYYIYRRLHGLVSLSPFSSPLPFPPSLYSTLLYSTLYSFPWKPEAIDESLRGSCVKGHLSLLESFCSTHTHTHTHSSFIPHSFLPCHSVPSSSPIHHQPLIQPLIPHSSILPPSLPAPTSELPLNRPSIAHRQVVQIVQIVNYLKTHLRLLYYTALHCTVLYVLYCTSITPPLHAIIYTQPAVRHCTVRTTSTTEPSPTQPHQPEILD